MTQAQRHCTQCGALTQESWVEAEQRTRTICAACGFVHYENPTVLVLTLVECGGKVLLCQRKEAPGAGLWMPPGGFVEADESLEHAAVRELREETGIIVDPDALELHVLMSLTWLSEIYVGFRVSVPDAGLEPGPEVSAAAYFSAADVPWDALAFRQIDRYLRDYFEELERGDARLYFARIGVTEAHRRTYAIAVSEDAHYAFDKLPPREEPDR